MRWRFRRPVANLHPASIADEAQRFLDGQYLDVALEGQREVPAWVWLSVVAHGDEKRLREVASWAGDHRELRPEFEEWGRLLEHLARQVLLSSSVVGRPISHIQRDLLIPLELAIFITPVGPPTLYRLVTAMFAVLETGSSVDHA